MKGGYGLVRLVSCGIFRNEYQLLPQAMREAMDPVFIDSILHMHPEKLEELLATFIPTCSGQLALILFGDCCPHMQELGCMPGVALTDGMNCCEIYLGQARYRTLRKEHTFFLMPEWAMRWEHVVKNELGFKDTLLARDFMTQSMSKAVYIDTGVIPVPEDELAAFEEFTGLQLCVETVGPANFITAMQTALQRLEQDEALAPSFGNKPGDTLELKNYVGNPSRD